MNLIRYTASFSAMAASFHTDRSSSALMVWVLLASLISYRTSSSDASCLMRSAPEAGWGFAPSSLAVRFSVSRPSRCLDPVSHGILSSPVPSSTGSGVPDSLPVFP